MILPNQAKKKNMSARIRQLEQNVELLKVNGNLKLTLNEPFERSKYTYTFHSIGDLEDNFDKFDWDIPELDNKE